MATRRLFDGTEVALIVVFASLVASGGARWLASDGAERIQTQFNPYLVQESAEYYAGKYGPSKNSTNVEEWLVRHFFEDRRGGIFLDVGAGDYRERSNTYFLETTLGWSGLAVDAQAEYAEGYVRYRPRTRFVVSFVSDRDGDTATLYIPENRRVASSNAESLAVFGGYREIRTVPTATLDTILTRAGIERLDFVSMDIELHEPQAPAGFSIERYRPELVCVEGHLPVRQAILDYFHRHGYVPVGKYWLVDRANLWFMPADRR